MSQGPAYHRACAATADFLDQIGEFKRANDLRGLMHSYSSLRSTASQSHIDNLALRKQLAEHPSA